MQKKHFCYALSLLTAAMLGFVSCSKDDPEVIINHITKDTLIKSEIVTNNKTIDVISSLKPGNDIFILDPGESIQVVDINPEGKSSMIFSSSNPDAISFANGKVINNHYGIAKLCVIYQNEILSQYMAIAMGGGLSYDPEKMMATQGGDVYYNQYTLIANADQTNTIYIYNNDKKLDNVEDVKELDYLECTYTGNNERVKAIKAQLITNGKAQEIKVDLFVISPNPMGTSINIIGFIDDKPVLCQYITQELTPSNKPEKPETLNL